MKKAIPYVIAFFFLMNAYVFGCMALYHFLLPYCGEPLTALSLCLLSVIIGLGLIVIGKRTKPHAKTPPPSLLSQLDHIPNSQDITKALLETSPKILITILGIVAVAAYAMVSKKK